MSTAEREDQGTPRSKSARFQNIFNKIMVAFYKHVFEHCQILTLHEEQQQQRDITLHMLVCVVVKLSY